MSRIARGPKVFVVCVALALGLAAGSGFVQRRELVVVGNACDVTSDNPDGLCYRQLPVGGLPFVFLRDSPGTSIVGSLGPEDDFHLTAFLADTLVFAGLLTAAVAAVRALRRRPSESSRS